MAKVTIYTGMMCGYCAAAMRLLEAKGVDFEEINVTLDREACPRMQVLTGGASSVPQIFIDNIHVGGCDELYALEQDGKLDVLLRGEGEHS